MECVHEWHWGETQQSPSGKVISVTAETSCSYISVQGEPTSQTSKKTDFLNEAPLLTQFLPFYGKTYSTQTCQMWLKILMQNCSIMFMTSFT